MKEIKNKNYFKKTRIGFLSTKIERRGRTFVLDKFLQTNKNIYYDPSG